MYIFHIEIVFGGVMTEKELRGNAILAAKKRHDFDNFFTRTVNSIQNSF